LRRRRDGRRDAGRTGFESFPRDDLDIRCTRTLAGPEAGSVCYVDSPRLEVVMTGSPTASRMAGLLAEAHGKLLG
jgi:hypothetical protein